MAHDTQQPGTENGIRLPAPTSSPFVCAFGVTLIFTGIVTIWSVSIIGFVIALVGAIRWWKEVLPDNIHQLVPFEEERVSIEPRPGGVAHLMVPGGTHRVRIPLEIHPYGAGAIGGLVGGIAMAVIAVAYGLIAEGSPWYTVNILAATILPSLSQDDASQLAQWHTWGFIFGTLIHLSMSIMIGLLYGVVLPMIGKGRILFAAAFIPLLWSGLAWGSLRVVNPVLNDHVNWTWFIISQIVFGAICGFIVTRSERISTMQNWSMLERLGVDSPGVPPIGGDDE